MKKLVILIFLLIYSKNILADQNNHSFADIIEPLLPSVVSIASTTIVSENHNCGIHPCFAPRLSETQIAMPCKALPSRPKS